MEQKVPAVQLSSNQNNMKKLYSFFILLFFSLTSPAQVTTDPTLPQEAQALTIYYDATQGTTGLVGAEKVYMHAGVITTGPNDAGWDYVVGNWGQDDGVGQMQRVEGEANLWQITIPSPREYFGLPEDERIYRIGMVFRNATGSREGKSDQGGDIFVQVYEGYAVSFTQPSEPVIFVSNGQQITVEAEATAASDISLTLNGQEVANYTNQTHISETFTFSTSGRERIIVSATSNGQSAADTLDVLYRTPSPVASLPEGLEQGINRSGANEVTLVLQAPGKESVYVVGDFTNWRIEPDYLMNQEGDLFWLNISGLDPDREYAYYYLVDENIKIADPYSEKVLDANWDHEITDERYPGLRPFPSEAETDRLTAFMVNEQEYNWQVTNYIRPEKSDLIIYELLIRDFSSSESIQGVIDRLDYLDSLNITAIQLMPVMEFNGNNSWGYNPTFMMALDKWYGTKEKLKELVDKAHQRGMAIILDITMNHHDYPNPFLKMWWTGTTASEENPFFFPRARHPFNVFTDMNHASAYTQEYLDNVNRYWLEEYNVDGFRFDLSKGFSPQDFCVTPNCDTGAEIAAWSAFNQVRIELLKRMATQIWELDSGAYIILEHFADNTEEKELADFGMMLWGNLNHNFSEAAMGWQLDNNQSSFEWLSYQARTWNEPNLVGYMESHDEERMMYRLLQYGNSNDTYSTKELSTALDRVKLAAAFFIPVPGPKMIWQFEELGYDVSIDFNGRVGKKPVKWEYLDDPDREQLFRTFSALNHLKSTYPVFETEDFQMPGIGEVRTLTLNGTDMNVLVVGNFGLTDKNASVAFQHSGWWYSYFDKDSVQSETGATSIALAPGEFRLYFDQPTFYTGLENPLRIEDSRLSGQISLYPNPAHRQITLLIQQPVIQSLEIRILDQLGRVVQVQQIRPNGERQYVMELQGLQSGLYMVEITSGKEKGVKRIMLY